MTNDTATRLMALGRDQLATIDASSGCIELVQGQAWLTETGDGHDRLQLGPVAAAPCC